MPIMRKRIAAIRALEAELDRPTTILADLQGPKLRVGRFKGDKAESEDGPDLRLRPRRDARRREPRQPPPPRDFRGGRAGHAAAGRRRQARLPGRSRPATDRIETRVEVGGTISNNKGLNVPDVRAAAGGADREGPRRPRLRARAGCRLDRPVLRPAARGRRRGAAADRRQGGLLAKIEKPAAIERLEGILELADAVMVARGDLGVEMPPEEVPPLQKRIVEAARRIGRPVVVATQMLESMIASPSPTRAEVSDVATAVYDGADAIMLSAESASGQLSVRGGGDDEPDRDQRRIRPQPLCPRPFHRDACPTRPPTTPSRAPPSEIVRTVGASAIVCFTSSGSTARRVARERPTVPLLVLTPSLKTARRLGLLWGAHAVRTRDVAQLRGDGRQVEADGAAPRRRQGRRPDHRHRRRPVRHAGLDQRRPCRAADRRRARPAQTADDSRLESCPRRSHPSGAQSPGIRSGSSRARKPIRPTRPVNIRPASPCSQTPQSVAVSGIGAAGAEAADDAGQHVAADPTSPGRRRRPSKRKARPSGRGDEAVRALDQGDRVEALGRAHGPRRAGRSRPPPARIRAAAPSRAHAAAGSTPPGQARTCSASGGKAAEHGGVEHQRHLGAAVEQARPAAVRAAARAACRSRWRPPAPPSPSGRAARCRLGDAAVLGLRHGRSPALRDGDGQRRGDASAVRDLELARAGAQRRRCRRARPRRPARGCRRSTSSRPRSSLSPSSGTVGQRESRAADPASSRSGSLIARRPSRRARR